VGTWACSTGGVHAPVADIEGVRQGTRKVLRTVADLTDDQAVMPSRLPSWTRAEVLTHLARNADGGRGIAEAAARGEIGMQYPGGAEQRAAEIAAGRGARAAALLADLRRSCDGLMEAWHKLPDDAWDRPGRSLAGERKQRDWVWSRWREVEVHHVDLGLGYSPSEWPVQFVSRGLDDAFADLANRATRNRGPVDTDLRIEATDHDRAWVVRLRDPAAIVERDDNAGARVDGVVSGWGCDVLAWLYGRDPSGAGLTASGDLSGLRLPEWFPFG
jgi:maleylpyruvate isomerase